LESLEVKMFSLRMLLIPVLLMFSTNCFADECAKLTGTWAELFNEKGDLQDYSNYSQGYIKVRSYAGKYKIWFIGGTELSLEEFEKAKSGNGYCELTTTKSAQKVKKMIFDTTQAPIKTKIKQPSGFHSSPKNIFIRIEKPTRPMQLNQSMIDNAEKEIPGSKW
jgi:hypothetical protein